MPWTRKSRHGGCERAKHVLKAGGDRFADESRKISAIMVVMEHIEKLHRLKELGSFFPWHFEHFDEIFDISKLWLGGGCIAPSGPMIDDRGGDLGKFGNHIQTIFPVIACPFAHPENQQRGSETVHRMAGLWQ